MVYRVGVVSGLLSVGVALDFRAAMSKYFTSLLKLVESPSPGGEAPDGAGLEKKAARPEAMEIQVDAEESRVSFLQADQPHPLGIASSTAQQPRVSLRFDRIVPAEAEGSALYRQTAREVVESALLGYHGTVITLASSDTRQQRYEAIRSPSHGMIQRAAKQMIRCLKKSQLDSSTASKSSSNLVIQCSFVVIAQEEIRDLLAGFSVKNKHQESPQKLYINGLPPKLEMMNKEVSGASQHVLVSGLEVSRMLRYGREIESMVLESIADSKQQKQQLQQQQQQYHHTIFTLTVEFSQFGSMNSPVSGNLQFVDISASGPLASRQKFTYGDRVDKTVLSLFTFVDLVESLSSNVAALENAGTHSAFNLEAEAALLPNVPTSSQGGSNLHEKSVLTQVIRDSLGGNCKTLLLTFAPVKPPVSLRGEVVELLKLASRARIVQNMPNKRDLAEKALMSAYLRGLEEIYGQAAGGNMEEEAEARGMEKVKLTSKEANLR